jgi:transposase-like protein
MSKGARKRDKKKVEARQEPVRRGMLEIVGQAQESLLELVVGFGFEAFEAMLEEDRGRLCGARYARSSDRQAYRHGSESGRLSLGGRQVRLSKPRVRSVAGEELSLPTWEAYRDEDPLGERAVEQILCGVSTRKYDRSLEPLGGEHESVGTSKSSVSRRFVARTRRQVEVFLSRPLEDLDLPVLMFDGVEMGRHLLIVALGIAWDGHKHVLGLVEGSTESSEVCRHLLRQLIARGLRVERRRLIVMDGSKGLAKAIRKTFGRWCVVQRCRVHKMRNVTDHLPKHLRPWFQAKIRKAWKIASAEEAKSKLFALARELETEHPGAAASLREGLDETLTVNWLGMSGALLQTLRSTNPIENLHDSMKRTCRNVKRWRGGSMVVRWAARSWTDQTDRTGGRQPGSHCLIINPGSRRFSTDHGTTPISAFRFLSP